MYREAPRPASDASAWGSLKNEEGQTYEAPRASAVPSDFDQEEFLRGAKMAYTRLQESWDRRDLDDIAQFATPAVVQELRAQRDEDPKPGVRKFSKSTPPWWKCVRKGRNSAYPCSLTC